jgi:16S rRNA (guanine966-N2)-methyltransferase
MRIISGDFKGKIIRAPASLPVRPTTDMAKEGLFNWLTYRFDFSQLDALDLFAGTGNITYELVSRGVNSVVTVDLNSNCYRFIQETIRKLKITNVQVFNTDAFVAIKRVKKHFDLIFADPPYDFNEYHKFVEETLKQNILKPDGWFIIEHPSTLKFNSIKGFIEQRNYGKVNFSFFQPNQSEYP